MKTLFLLLFVAFGVSAADVKITALPTTNVVHTPDIFPLVTQPGGVSATTKSATLGVLATSLSRDQGMITNNSTVNFIWNSFGDYLHSDGTASFAQNQVTIDAFGNVSGVFLGDGAGLSQIRASNIVSGGQLPLGTVSTGLVSYAGPFLTTNTVARTYSYNANALTNLNASELRSGTVPVARLPFKTNVILSVVINGSGSTVPTGRVYANPVAGDNWTISGWAITAQGNAPTATFDVWKIANGINLPTVANTIMGTKPALSNGNVTNSTAMVGWTTSVTNQDIWGVNLDSVANATNITFQLFGYRQ